MRYLFSLFLVLSSASFGFAKEPDTVCILQRFIDGDTFKCATQDNVVHTVRIDGIDAPELDQTDGKRIRDSHNDTFKNTAFLIDTSRRDMYGRILSQVTWVTYNDLRNASSGVSQVDLGRYFVNGGDAWAYKGDKRYQLYMEGAREAGFSLWQKYNPIPPWEWRKSH